MRKFIILSGLLLLSFQGDARLPSKNMLPPSLPQDEGRDPFGDPAFNLDDSPPSGEGPPALPLDDDVAPPRKGKGSQKKPASSVPPLEDFPDDLSGVPPLPPEAGGLEDLPPLSPETPPKQEAPPPKPETPPPFSWSSIDLHNLAKQAGRKADDYKA